MKYCQSFRTANDTDKWVLCLDERIGVFDSKEELENAIKPITGVHWDDTGHDCMQILPPGYVPVHDDFSNSDDSLKDKTSCYVSEIQPIDMVGYIDKHVQRVMVRQNIERALKKISSSGFTSASQRLENIGIFKRNGFFLN